MDKDRMDLSFKDSLFQKNAVRNKNQSSFYRENLMDPML